MPRPVCVECRCEMRCNKNGRVLELVSAGEPYQLWSADEFKCPLCGVRVLTRYGGQAMAEGYQKERYDAMLEVEGGRDNVVSIVV